MKARRMKHDNRPEESPPEIEDTSDGWKRFESAVDIALHTQPKQKAKDSCPAEPPSRKR